MSLQGTLDTFSLGEILELVERSRKTGALEVRDPQPRGVLYFAGGRFSAAEAGDLNGPVETAAALESRLLDVCFGLFRIQTGFFEFENDRFPPWPVRGDAEIAPVVEQVQRLCRDWQAIEAVVPSLDCCPSVVDDLDGDQVVLDRAGFRVLRAIDGARNVTAIARSVGASVLEVGTVLKDLVEAGAVTVATVPVRAAVNELVLPSDAGDGPVGAERASVRASFVDEVERGPDLHEMHGLVVPSSPEGLVEPDGRPEAIDSEAEIEAGGHSEDAEVPARAHGPEVNAESTVATPAERGDDEVDEDDDDDEPAPDRGALLRLFSSLRDT